MTMSTTEQADTPTAAPVEQPVGDGPLAGIRVLDLGTVTQLRSPR
jgi:hypothetical protein